MADIKITPTNLTGNLSAKITSAELVIQQGNVTRTPADLTNLSRATVLRGEVQQQNSDGTTRIKTPRGNVDVKLEASLPKGQKVDIQLSSGSPPRDAIVQTQAPKVQAQPQSQTQPAQQQPVQNQVQQTAQAQPSQSQNPVPQTPSQTTQPAPAVQQGQTLPPNTAIDAVKNLQITAKQAIETLANGTRPVVDPTQIGKTGEKSQLQTQSSQNTQNLAPNINAKPLLAGQAIRLTPLPASLQNPNGLAQLPTVQSAAPIQTTALQTITSAPVLTSSVLPTAGHTPVLQTSSLPQTPLLTPNTGQPTLTPTSISGVPQLPTIQPSLTASVSSIQTVPNALTTLQISLTSTPNTLQDARVLTVQTPVIQTPSSTPATNFTVNNVIANPNTPTATANIHPTQILVQTTGQITPQGNPIVQIIPQAFDTGVVAAPTFFALNYPATNLPKGTQIILQPTLNQSTAPSAPQAWPQLAEAFEELLPQLQPTQAQSLLNIIPRPAAAGHQFTATALLFLAAARGGEISGWMGARADQLIQGSSKKEMVTRLLSDIGSLTARAASSDTNAPVATLGSPDWRGYTLPLLFGMDLSKIHLWTKPFGDDDSEDADLDRARGTRFIVDLELSRMGNVQLDGLVQPYAKRLDLALKTAHDFAPDVRQYLRETWQSALQSIDMTGQLDFQTA